MNTFMPPEQVEDAMSQLGWSPERLAMETKSHERTIQRWVADGITHGPTVTLMRLFLKHYAPPRARRKPQPKGDLNK